MPANYFQRVHAETPTRLWINNPTGSEAERAIVIGARSCTTNPTYSAKIFPTLTEADRQGLIARAWRGAATADDAVGNAQGELVTKLLHIFSPFYRGGMSSDGLVSIQGNPHNDTDTNVMLHEAERFAALGSNVIYKIPATRAGLIAIEDLLRRGKPVLATEMMSVTQTRAACDVYRRVVDGSSARPVFILTHITGIFDQYLAATASSAAPTLSQTVLAEAGFLVARRVRAVIDESGLPIGLMGGGARTRRHFADMVGGNMMVTINPDTVEDLVTRDEPVTPRFATAIDGQQVATLRAQLPDFQKAWDDDGLRVEEFEHYGPIRLFLSMFIKGWDAVREQLAAVAPLQSLPTQSPASLPTTSLATPGPPASARAADGGARNHP